MPPAPALGDLELAVLDVLWQGGSADAKTVHAAIGASRGIGLNTVQSTLERLFRKALLSRQKVSHAYQYRAEVSRNALVGRLVESAVQRVAAGDGDGLIAAFVDLASRADTAQLERMAQLISRRRSAANEEGG